MSKVKVQEHEQGRIGKKGRSLYTSGFSSIGFTERNELVDHLEHLGYRHRMSTKWAKDARKVNRVRIAQIFMFERPSGQEVWYYRSYEERTL